MKRNLNLVDRLFGAVIIFIGILGLMECKRMYPYANSSLSGDHVMLGITGGALIVLGLIMLIFPGKRKFSVQYPEKEVAVRMVLTLIVLVIYVAALEKIGFIVSTAVCGLVFARLFGGYSWIKCALITVLSTAVLYAVFVLGLGMSFPSGILG